MPSPHSADAASAAPAIIKVETPVIRYRHKFIAIKLGGKVVARVPDQEGLDAWLAGYNGEVR